MNSDTLNRIKDLQLPSRFEQKLIADLHYLFDYNIPELEAIILFGSCARNKIRLTSDIDLLVITTTPLSRITRGEIASDLEDAFDAVKTDVIFYTREQYDYSSRIFTEQVKTEGICLYSNQV